MAIADTVLTETVIDVSDRHTLADYSAASAGLPFATEQGYCDLHRRINETGHRCIDYGQARGAEGTMLDRLCLGYVDEKFWHFIVNDSFAKYPAHAWHRLLPLAASLKPRIQFVKRNWTFEIKPKTGVLLYPFGWSTRLSFLIVGPHSLADLADVVDCLVNGRCIRPMSGPTPLRSAEYFEHIADGVRTDAFAGSETNDTAGPAALMVVTVLAKHGPSPSVKALTSADQTTMLRLVRPTDRPSSKPFADRVRYLLPNDPFQYALVHEGRYFMWLQSRMRPEKRNRQLLRCHHNNTFESLDRARHLKALIDNAVQSPSSGAAESLLRAAEAELNRPCYKGKLVLDFVQGQEVKDSLKQFAG